MRHTSNHTIWTVVTALAAAVVAPASAADIALRPKAIARNSVVRLSDVAEIRATDHEEVQRLAALPLMPAPSPGKKRFLRMREVQDLLAAHGEGMNQHNFRGEVVVEIAPAPSSDESSTAQVTPQPISRFRETRKGNPTAAGATQVGSSTMTEAQTLQLNHQLTQVITEYLRRASQREVAWQVTFDVAPADLASVARATSPLKCAGGNSPWTGRQRLVISFATNLAPARIAVMAEVTATQPVVVATQPIMRGDILTAADIEVQQLKDVPNAKGRRAPLDSVESLLGMEAARPIQAGDILLVDDVQPRQLVKRGEEIIVIARGGGIQVRALARARQNGARGELIAVESLESKEVYDAVVVGMREAVVFSGAAAPAEEELSERPFRNLRQ